MYELGATTYEYDEAVLALGCYLFQLSVSQPDSRARRNVFFDSSLGRGTGGGSDVRRGRPTSEHQPTCKCNYHLFVWPSPHAGPDPRLFEICIRKLPRATPTRDGGGRRAGGETESKEKGKNRKKVTRLRLTLGGLSITIYR